MRWRNSGWYLAKDPRGQFAYGFQCGMRHFRWLFDYAPQDFCQTISIASCLRSEKDTELSRLVNRQLYRLATDLGFRRWRTERGRHYSYEPYIEIIKEYISLADTQERGLHNETIN